MVVGSDQSVSPTKSPPDIAQQSSNSEFHPIIHIKVKTNKCPHIKVGILGKEVDALLDSGAAISIISDTRIVERHNFRIRPTDLKIRTADETEHQGIGMLHIPYTFQGITVVVPTLYVPQIAKQLILGIDFWNRFGIKPAISDKSEWKPLNTSNAIEIDEIKLNTATEYFAENTEELNVILEPSGQNMMEKEKNEDESLEIPTVEQTEEFDLNKLETEHVLNKIQKQELIRILKKFKTNGNLGRTSMIQHKIELIEGAIPKRPPKYRRSPAMQREIQKEIDRMIELDVIEESSSDWCNPLLPVRKPSGEWRVCLDCRNINKVTKNEAYPLPDMQDILAKIEKATYFSVLDLSKAYWQIPLEESSKDFTSFRSGRKLYRFKVMPFGLKGAPTTQTKLMQKVIGFDLEPAVYVYMDDIIILSNTLEEHFKLLEIIAERLSKAGLTISLEKSKICQKKVHYLGYILSEEGLSIDSEKLEPILSYPVPKTVKEIRCLIGMVGFFKQFIPNYSEILSPITDLLKKNSKIIWNKEADAALDKIKSLLTSPPVLANPRFGTQFIIESDASAHAVGAVLMQEHDGQRRPISFYSKKLTAAQQKYSATERECLGVILAIERFRHYIEGTVFMVITDAQSLKWLNQVSVEGNSARLVRWAIKLQQYDFELEYRKGGLNMVADALSRINTVDVIANDVEYEKLKKEVDEDPRKFKDFRVVRNRIYKYVADEGQADPRFKWKYYPPRSERISILEVEHGLAHLGTQKTLKKIQEKYYWPRMSTEIKRYCSACEECKRSKHPNTNQTPTMGRQKVADLPWQIISVDYVGPFPRSKQGNTMLLVITDLFSKFVVIQPMREAKTTTLIKFLENMIFLQFSVPEIVISDNGPQFKSALFASLLKRYKVTHWRNANYHPANNPTERVNRVINSAIRAHLKEDQTDWDLNIQKIAMAIRTATHDSTEFTPYFVNYGRNYISLGDEYQRIRDTAEGVKFVPREQTEEIFTKVKENLKKAYHRYEKYYNLRANDKLPDFEIGELVYKRNYFQSSKPKKFNAKLAKTYSLAKIISKIGSNCYELEDEKGVRLGIFKRADLMKKN